MELIWVKNSYMWYQGASAKLKLKKSDQILRNERLGCLSRIVLSSDRIESLVLVKRERLCVVALKRGEWILPICGAELQNMDLIPLEEDREYIKEFRQVEQSSIDDPSKLADVLSFDGVFNKICNWEDSIEKLLPERFPPIPQEIPDGASPGDDYGLFSRTTYWWWQKSTGYLHIVGSESADGFFQQGAGSDAFEGKSLLTKLLMLLTGPKCIRNMVIHEGITSFCGSDFYPHDYMDDYCFKEVILPSTLTSLIRLNCYTEKLKIPESLKTLDMYSLVNDINGHWDPVTFAAKTLILPSSIAIRQGPTPLEPTLFWETLELYGEQPIEHLDEWYDEGMLNTSDVTMLEIRYPAQWDREIPGAYANELMEYIRKQDPLKPDWSAGNSMYTPCKLVKWTQEDFEEWRSHINPK